jgi:hypothetical protein
MEDRITPALYLEMTDLPADDYATGRALELRAAAGVERVTWWQNCVPFRTDLPRRLPEFKTLGLVEADLAFAPSAPADGAAGHLFHRTPRPAQGNLDRRPTLGLELVLVSPKHEAGAQALRDWADFIHIRDIAAAAAPHFKMITPYENAHAPHADGPRYLHLYELDTDDPEPAFQEMTPATVAHRKRAGGHSWREWSGHPELVIDYVNTFRLLGEHT